MIRIIDGTSIQEHKVLIGSTPTYIKSTGSLTYSLDTRKSLYHLQYIHFTHSHRNVFQESRLYLFHTQYRILNRLNPATGHQHFLHHKILFFQFNTHIGIGIEYQLTTGILHTDSLQLQQAISRLQFHAEISVFISYSHIPWLTLDDMNTCSRDIRLEVNDLSCQFNLSFFRRTELVTNLINPVFRG